MREYYFIEDNIEQSDLESIGKLNTRMRTMGCTPPEILVCVDDSLTESHNLVGIIEKCGKYGIERVEVKSVLLSSSTRTVALSTSSSSAASNTTTSSSSVTAVRLRKVILECVTLRMQREG